MNSWFREVRSAFSAVIALFVLVACVAGLLYGSIWLYGYLLLQNIPSFVSYFLTGLAAAIELAVFFGTVAWLLDRGE